MSSIHCVVFGFIGLGCLSLIAGVARADDAWQTNFESAKAKAKAEHKLLLVEFSGSDWCPWCKKMQTDVFDKEVFKTESRNNFVLVNLDYPNQKEQSAELKRQNGELKKQYQVNVFPSIMVMDPKGQVIAKTNYRSGGPDEFVKDMNGFVKTHKEVVAMKQRVEHTAGLERAKLLDSIVMDEEQLGVESDDIPRYTQEIIALDPDNKTGLKLKYTFRGLMAEARSLANSKKFDAARATYEKAAALPGIKGQRKQIAWFAEAECCASAQEFVRAVSLLKRAREAAPEGPKVSEIDDALKQDVPLANAEREVNQLNAEADSAQGLNRARALDRLVEAQVKFGQLTPAEHHPQEVEQWSDEIIALDADNRAGLKTKYEVRELLVAAAKDLKAGDKEQARAAIKKARQIPDLTDDQKTKIRELSEKLK